MNKVELSVIIVSYNTKEILKNCLFSVFNTIDSDFEVIVIDNASNDGSVEMVREEFPSVNLIVNKKNLGFASAINQGLKESKGKYRLLLNSDTILVGNAAEKMLEFLKKNPSVGAVRPKVLSPGGKLQRQGSGFLRFLKNPNKLHKLKWVSGCCVMIRDEVMKNTGLFDENFFFYNEDVDYSYRMKKNGWELYCFPEASVIHSWGASSSDTDKLLMENYRGKYYYYQKHFGKFVLFFYRILITFRLVIKTCFSFFSYDKKVKREADIYCRILKLTFVILLSFFSSLSGESPVANLASPKASGIRVGEELTYNVKFGIFSAGKQIVHVTEKTNVDSYPVYHIISRTRTNQFFSMFYKMDNRIEAFVDEKSLSLRKLVKDLNEGNFHQKSIAVLDLEKGKGQIIMDSSSQNFEVPPLVLDIVSLPYYLRSIELQLNQKISLNILTDSGVKTYEPEVEAREIVSTYIGKFDTFRIVETKEKIKVWISADSKHIPVKIAVGTNFGEIVGILEKIE